MLMGPETGSCAQGSAERCWRSMSHRRSSELHKLARMTSGHMLFCKEFLCFNTMPCRHMPLLVHFRDLASLAPQIAGSSLLGRQGGARRQGNHAARLPSRELAMQCNMIDTSMIYSMILC